MEPTFKHLLGRIRTQMESEKNPDAVITEISINFEQRTAEVEFFDGESYFKRYFTHLR